MSTATHKPLDPGEPASAVKHDQRELERWAEGYRQTAGPKSEVCDNLLRQLFEREALDAAAIDRTLELLDILVALSADPITISCAIAHVAGQGKRDISDIVAAQPLEVRRQLEELGKLKHY